jgi:hypothetical protein
MKSSDKLLIGIVAGIVLLVVAALAITLSRPEPTYQSEDTPEGVAHNYLLAIQKQDHERAHGYLSPTLPGYPSSPEEFTEDTRRGYSFRIDENTSLGVESAKVTGHHAEVEVRESRFYRGDLFSSSQRSYAFKMELEGDEWKIVNSDRYFAWRWRNLE